MGTIDEAIERLEQAVARRPGFGVGTARSVTTADAGLRCVTVDGDRAIATDLSPAFGGTASAPSPGELVRAALGSCMAMSYRLRAAKHGIEITSVSVTVETDHELAGMLSCDSAAPPGFTAVRYHVDIESPASSDDVTAILDEADELSPILDVFVRANEVARTVAINKTERVAAV